MPLRATSNPTRARELTKSARQGQSSIRGALKALTPLSRERVKASGLTSTRVQLKTRSDSLATATQPSITFSVAPSGKLESPSVAATGRHEVAHFSLPGSSPGRFPTAKQTARQHFSLKAAGASGQSLSVPSGGVLRRAESTARQPSTTRVAQSLKFLGARLRRRKTSQVK